MQINAGVRYEETEVPSSAEVRVPVQVNWVAASEWITQFEDELQVQDFTGEYDILLPMFDVKVDVTDDIVARFSWGKINYQSADWLATRWLGIQWKP